MNEQPRMVSATVTVEIDGKQRMFSSTIFALAGQEGFMLDTCWAHTRKEAMEALEKNEQQKR